MSKCIEFIQTECECEASVCSMPLTFYEIKAKVEDIPGHGKQLKITINPPLNTCSECNLDFDGSQLPENMVKDWLKSTLNQGQNLHSFIVTNSNKHGCTMEVVDK